MWPVRVAFVCLVLAACGFPKPQDVGSDDAPPGGSDAAVQDAAADAPPDAPGQCDVFTQTGCGANQRCTYINQGSALGVMCESMGTAGHGSACTTDPTTALDNCMAGDVCAGTCKPVCSLQGSNSCGSGSVCNRYSRGNGTISACDRMCDPLSDNDFDGPAALHSKTGTVCTAAMEGCYGAPSSDSTRPTAFTCTTDINYAQQALHHRSLCDTASGCESTAGNPFLNGCNQGYAPLLQEQTGSTNVVCVAFCKPVNCFQNNCGSPVGTNQLGAAPHRCNQQDAVGNFNTVVAGEQCTFVWLFEIDQTGNHAPSPYSNSVGVCLDHSKYQYDSNADGTPDTPLPPCSTLPDGFGSGTTSFGAADLGCVDTTHAGIPAHAPRKLVDIRFPTFRAP
jgi:hypothetical protein